MEKKKRLSIFESLKWLSDQYQLRNRKKNKENAYRVVEYFIDNKGNIKVAVQITGKKNIYKYYPAEILADDAMLKRFATRDIRTLTYLARNEARKPQYKIRIQHFCEESQQMKFSLQRCGTPYFIEKTANELSLDKALLEKIDQHDALLIGYTTAQEQMQQEKKQLEQNKAKKHC